MVPLLESLVKCNYMLKDIKIQYYIEGYFVKESDEVTQWIKENPWFNHNLKTFKRVPIQEYAEFY